jgi:hypothetical protein
MVLQVKRNLLKHMPLIKKRKRNSATNYMNKQASFTKYGINRGNLLNRTRIQEVANLNLQISTSLIR